MDNKPNTNLAGREEDEKDEKTVEHPSGMTVGGDHIVVRGNVGVGANIGRGTVQAENIAGGDITNHNGGSVPPKKEFDSLCGELKGLIVEAHKSGELNEKVARKALTNLQQAHTLVTKEDSPPKNEVIRRLQYVADVLDAAVDMFSASGGAASTLLKALPIATLLIKVASRIF